MEMNVEKTKVMRISRQPSPVKIMIDQKQKLVKCYIWSIDFYMVLKLGRFGQ
jgi:hypothetical protein